MILYLYLSVSPITFPSNFLKIHQLPSKPLMSHTSVAPRVICWIGESWIYTSNDMGHFIFVISLGRERKTFSGPSKFTLEYPSHSEGIFWISGLWAVSEGLWSAQWASQSLKWPDRETMSTHLNASKHNLGMFGHVSSGWEVYSTALPTRWFIFQEYRAFVHTSLHLVHN